MIHNQDSIKQYQIKLYYLIKLLLLILLNFQPQTEKKVLLAFQGEAF